MKKQTLGLILVAIIIYLLGSCSPGRWVPGNAKRFQKRSDLVSVKQRADTTGRVNK